ncbi:hypothetical protein TRFO_04986 [Tritrichomonas foetus]|uniref:Protein kinase domain-containing protein n=1 Tax=Tritrichomonas foetus TaxID=1144522 RepID=A0A1J4KAU2_9EUKA|nr:hypothetical protein TRFO_04986 [Tritrichomonas foetus]|eukprot:OHT08347.1 hypothetical protein TRFO_04986 [Tritrichomonas foetus]
MDNYPALQPREAFKDNLSKFELNYEDLTFDHTIGVGSYGEVWQGKWKDYPNLVAIKKLHATELDEQGKNIYYHEISSLAQTNHEFIVPFIGYTKEAPYCIVTKYIPNDSLFNALRDDPKGLKLTATDIQMIAYGIAQGMAFLHSKGITHRDLKSQNILIDENKLPVICDFGSSRKATNSQPLKTAECGTPNYMAPEFMKGETYTNSVDVYSFGLILWEMITKKLPFDNLQPAQVIFAVLIDHKRPPIPSDTPQALSEVMQQCWSENPSERPPFEELVPHFENGDILYSGCDKDSYLNLIKTLHNKQSHSPKHSKGSRGSSTKIVSKSSHHSKKRESLSSNLSLSSLTTEAASAHVFGNVSSLTNNQNDFYNNNNNNNGNNGYNSNNGTSGNYSSGGSSNKSKKKTKYVALPRYVKKGNASILNSQTNYSLAEMYKSEERIKTSPVNASTHDLLHAYLFSLSDRNTKLIHPAINYLTAHIDDPGLLKLPFWSHVLNRLVHGPPSDFEILNGLAVSLAQSKTKLEMLSSIKELHTYVAPQSLDVFLYIVTFTEQFVTPKIIEELEKLCDDQNCALKAYKLLSKILMYSNDEKNCDMVINFLKSRILSLTESQAGSVALRALFDHDAVSDDYIKAFLLSSNTECCLAGYNALFIKEQQPNLLKVPTLLKHLTCDDSELRGAAFEFVRRFARKVEGPVLAQILDALLTAVFRFSSENAVLLICCFAADYARAPALLLPQISAIWLNASPSKAPHMMRFFAVLFRQPPFRRQLIEIPEVPQFLSTVLHGDKPDAALSVCWVISIVSEERDFLIKINETETTEAIVKWLCMTREPRAVKYFTQALFAISECTFSPSFRDVLKHILTLVSENNSACLLCLKLLVSFSCYKEMLESFISANTFLVLGRYKPNDENERLIIRNIYDNLRKAGLVLPI